MDLRVKNPWSIIKKIKKEEKMILKEYWKGIALILHAFTHSETYFCKTDMINYYIKFTSNC